jgi:hypothetical protein
VQVAAARRSAEKRGADVVKRSEQSEIESRQGLGR